MGTGSTIREEQTISQMCIKLSQAVLRRDCKTVRDLTQRLMDSNTDYYKILNEGLIPGMLQASERFRKGDFFIPELLISSRALEVGLDLIKPLIRNSKNQTVGKVVIGSVQFDLHDIGKNMVVILLRANGFEVVDLGVNVSPDKFVRAAEKNEADMLAMSSLLTSTMLSMKTTIELVHASGLGKSLKILVGGAPVTPIFAKNIGADAYCREATSVASVARSLLKLPEHDTR